MTLNKWAPFTDVEQLLQRNNVDPAVIARACEINEELKSKMHKREEHSGNVIGGIFLCGVLATQTSCWQMCIPLFLLVAFAAFHRSNYN